MTQRTVKKVHAAYRDDIGPLQTRRPVPSKTLRQVDPFLSLNHHGPQRYPPRNGGLPFGPHPHTGLESISFVIQGDLLHEDSEGRRCVVGPGGVQWTTAGRGLVHSERSSERFLERGGPLELLQLWVNLPARLKRVAPRCLALQQKELPEYSADRGRVRVQLVCGTWGGRTGAVEPLQDLTLMLVRLQEGGRARLPAPRDRNVLLYVVSGELQLGGRAVAAYRLVELNDDGGDVHLQASRDARVLFGHARPLAEPVVTHGPFVMNTREEILQAVRDYQAGKFDHPPRRTASPA